MTHIEVYSLCLIQGRNCAFLLISLHINELLTDSHNRNSSCFALDDLDGWQAEHSTSQTEKYNQFALKWEFSIKNIVINIFINCNNITRYMRGIVFPFMHTLNSYICNEHTFLLALYFDNLLHKFEEINVTVNSFIHSLISILFETHSSRYSPH